MNVHVIPAQAGIQFRRHTLGPGLRRGDSCCAGFSLIELMIALAIFGLLLGLGVPSYRDWIASRQLANHAEYLAETLNQARSEAVKRSQRVNLCKSVDGKQCADTGTWSAGWIMFADDNVDGGIENAGSFIRHDGPPGNGITVTANRPLDNYVSYTSFGYARLLNGALQMGTFVVCKPGQNAIDVVLANSGRVRISRTKQPCP
jgi:type IV fimbrial biogenesis protein FimT